jgi:hypothetical protein
MKALSRYGTIRDVLQSTAGKRIIVESG